MALPPQPQGPELTHWSQLCLTWFMRGADPVAQAALAFFDSRCVEGSSIGGSVSFSRGRAVASTRELEMVKHPEAVDVSTALRGAGLLDAAGVPVALGPERYAAYIRVRNEARMEAHKLLLAERRARFRDLLVKHAPAVGGPRSRFDSDGPLLAHGTFDEVRRVEEDFVARHSGSLGAHPFFIALRTLLQKQLGDRMVWCWIISDEALIEAGNDQFLEDALELLAGTLQLIPRNRSDDCSLDPSYSALGGDLESPESGKLVWEVAPRTSDRHIQRFLNVLPQPTKLEGSATGQFVKTAVLRTNIGGEMDEDNGCFGEFMSRCEIL